MFIKASQGVLMHADRCTLTTSTRDSSPVKSDSISRQYRIKEIGDQNGGKKNQLPSESLRGPCYTMSNDSEPKAFLSVSDASFVLHLCNLICLGGTLSRVNGCRCAVQESGKRES